MFELLGRVIYDVVCNIGRHNGGYMYKALVCCKAGMGSSMLLKIKADQVIQENKFPIETIHGNLDSILHFEGDLVITMSDLQDELEGRVPYVIGIKHVIDKAEMKEKMKEFISCQKETK